ncbi:hypothetical protein cand_027160 [Cryptosporidium andersoni]|uniref:C3H1-type domain-containing protein n=1 Tax=Cryptosporidium andersoni TaxID=117008 RepID=A0A1J4MQ72_9CRYT|nr:hypothetical protein cand_027160 [Cryptosporidium andersoni]
MESDDLIRAVGEYKFNSNLISASDLSPNLSGLQQGTNNIIQDGYYINNRNVDMFSFNSNFNVNNAKDEEVTKLSSVSICELRYIVLICIEWRLKHHLDSSCTDTLQTSVDFTSQNLSIIRNNTSRVVDLSALIPNDDVILSNLYLYKSCISKLQREELELQIVSNIMRLIDSNSFDLEKKRMQYPINHRSSYFNSNSTEVGLQEEFGLHQLPIPYITTFLGTEVNNGVNSIGDIINTVEHPSGLNLANIASTPTVLSLLQKKFYVLLPSDTPISFENNESELENNNNNVNSTDDYGQLKYESTPMSLGSLTHFLGLCKPCVFVNKTNKKCRNGVTCCFCHHQHKERKRGKRYKNNGNNSSNNCNNGNLATNINSCHINQADNYVRSVASINVQPNSLNGMNNKNPSRTNQLRYFIPPPPPPPTLSSVLPMFNSEKCANISDCIGPVATTASAGYLSHSLTSCQSQIKSAVNNFDTYTCDSNQNSIINGVSHWNGYINNPKDNFSSWINNHLPETSLNCNNSNCWDMKQQAQCGELNNLVCRNWSNIFQTIKPSNREILESNTEIKETISSEVQQVLDMNNDMWQNKASLIVPPFLRDGSSVTDEELSSPLNLDFCFLNL